MCGIVGIHYFDPQRPVHENQIKLMLDRIVHRGPNDAGVFVSANTGIGMRRLSIIDIAGGHQPMFSLDGSKAIVFNGEVYNFLEERKALVKKGYSFNTNTDTEVVLRLFEEYGLDFFKHLNGMFGLAIFNKNSRSILIARDRIGIKPLYYYRDNEKLVFSSEIKAIAAVDGIDTGLDEQGMAAYFKYGFTPAPHTLYSRIYKIPPAFYLLIQDGEVSIQEYWRLTYQNKFDNNESEVADRLFELFKSSVQYQLISDVPLGAFLSGGIDSSSIVHMMRELGTERINTYSIGFGKGYEAVDELDDARQFARDYHTNHHEIIVKPDVSALFPELIEALDEPVADSSYIVTYLVSKLAKESVTVILSGIGGDELFGGYRRYLGVRFEQYLKRIPAWLRRCVITNLLTRVPVDRNNIFLNYVRLAKAYLERAELPLESQYAQHTSVFEPSLAWMLFEKNKEIPDYHDKYFNDCDSVDCLDKFMYYDLKMSLPEQLLMLTDKMSMKTSLEARVPYLDHRLVEFAARVPSDYKIKQIMLRYIQKKMLKGHVPNYIITRKKKGFGAPIGTWIRSELRELVGDLLSASFLEKQGIFCAKHVGSLLAAHYHFRQDHTDRILALIGFQLWHQSILTQFSNSHTLGLLQMNTTRS